MSSNAEAAARDGARTPVVVFACRANGGRSVASRLLAEHYARGRVTALSAGTEPGERIHPEVAEVLDDLGLDTSRESPKLLTTEVLPSRTRTRRGTCRRAAARPRAPAVPRRRSPRATRTRPRCRR